MVNTFQTSSSASPLRALYLDSLVEPQEYFVESLVSDGTTYTNGYSAYAVVSGETLVELYATPDSTTNVAEFFQRLVNERLIKKVLCKSFDTQLLYAAFSLDAKVRTAAYLFRRISNVPLAELSDTVSFRAGNRADIDSVMRFNDDFFEDEGEVVSYLECDGFFVTEMQGEVIGCGIAAPVVKGGTDIDIGMMVSPQHRNKGIGSYTVSCLKNHYLQQGLRPICGCAASNIASKKALEKAGFVSQHRLLSITY